MVVGNDSSIGWDGGGEESVSTICHESTPLLVVAGGGEGGGGEEGRGDFMFPNELTNGFPNGLPNGFPNGLPNGIPNGLPNGDISGSSSAREVVAGDGRGGALLAGAGVEPGDFTVPNEGNRGSSSGSNGRRSSADDSGTIVAGDNWSSNTAVGSSGAPLSLPGGGGGGRFLEIERVANSFGDGGGGAGGAGPGGGGVFETGDEDETSDVLIGLDDDAVKTVGDGGSAAALSELGGVTLAVAIENTTPKTESAEHLIGSANDNNNDALSRGEGKEEERKGAVRGDAEEVSKNKNAGIREGDGGGVVPLPEVRGEEDEEVLERLLELAEATKVSTLYIGAGGERGGLFMPCMAVIT